MRAICCYAALFLTASLARADSVGDSERRPVPNSSQQTVAWNAIKAQYKEQLAKREPADQLALSQEFRRLAVADSDPARKYVLLREARELAVDAADFDAAFATIDEMDKAFKIEAEEMRVSALTAAIDKTRIPPTQLIDNYLKVANQSLDDGDWPLAAQASRLATKIAWSLRDPALKAKAKQTDLKIHDAHRDLVKIEAAFKKLASNPDDPETNLIVGRYVCFVRGGWEQGLPVLAKGSDARLRELAEKDLDEPADPAAMLALADQYWDLPDSKEAPQRGARKRAAYWYEKALPKLTPDQRPKAEQRIADAKSRSHASP